MGALVEGSSDNSFQFIGYLIMSIWVHFHLLQVKLGHSDCTKY